MPIEDRIQPHPDPALADKYWINLDTREVIDRKTHQVVPKPGQAQAAPLVAPVAAAPAAPQDPFMKGVPPSQQGAMSQLLGAQDPFQNKPGPIDVGAGALAALSGGAGGLAESAAMKALPALAARTLPTALGRGVAAGIGSEAPYLARDVATGQADPLTTAAGIGMGALGGLGGSVGERIGASMKEGRAGGGKGLMTRVTNKVMDIVGLPRIEQPQLEKTFTAKKPIGVNQPQTEGSLFQKYNDGPYKQTIDKVEQLWPTQGMPSSSLDDLVKEKGKANLSPSALDKYEAHQQAQMTARAALASANALPVNTAAQQTAKQNAVAAAQRRVRATSGPVLYDFKDINSTAEKIRDEGFHVVGEGAKEGGDAKVARQRAHDIVDSLVGNIGNLDPALGQQFANDRVNLRRVSVFNDIMQHSLSGDNAGIAKMIHKYFNEPETRQLMKETFGEHENDIARLLSRGFISPTGEGNVAASRAADTLEPDSSPIIVRGSLFHPSKWSIIERIGHAVPRLLRPEAQPGTIQQLLQTGIPVAAMQGLKDSLFNPYQQEE